MSIGTKEANMINKMNRVAMQLKLGDELKETQDDIVSKKFVTKALVAGDITAGVATVDTGIDFSAWYSVTVTTALGVPVVITKIEKGTEANVTKILITATNVAATDIVSVIVK